MSVVGFDIGNFKSSIGIARAGGVEIVANEYSDRITPTYCSFTNNERYQGHAAKQQEVTNHKNTVSSFKRFLGRKFNDPQIQNEAAHNQMRVSSTTDNKIQFNIDYMNETRGFSAEQITAMFLTKLKGIAEFNINTKVIDCVISVPSFMTDTERRAILDAAQIAGLNCLKLMNETTAVALCYGIYNATLPEIADPSHKVIFVDMGYTQLQASVVAFNKGKLRILATAYDNNLGGRDFDKVLIDHFQEEFKVKYKIDVSTNTRARIRLRTECEKLKKLMSSNSSPIPLNIECFMNDIDVTSKMKRDDFESLSSNLLTRVRKTLSDLLVEAKLKNDEIDLVEIVGGSTRIPAIKQIIQEVYNKQPATTLNQDEACARGCTLMCAILSPTFRVKDFKIEDSQLFPIVLTWKGAETDDNELEVFPQYDKIPMSKLLTIYKKEPFEIEARYRYPNNIPINDSRIGKFLINNVTPNAKGENSEVKLKARVTKSGIFEISSPQLIEVIEPSATDAAAAATADGEAEEVVDGGEKMNEEQKDESPAAETPTEDPATTTTTTADVNSPQAKVSKKKKTKSTDLPLVAKVPQLSKQDLNNLIEQELSMIAQDRKEKERSEAKNSVEEYIYESRDKVNSGEHAKFIAEDVKVKFMRLLEDMENWLYSDDAENQEKSVYVEKLNSMKQVGEPMRKRYRENEERPRAFEELGRSIQLIKKAVNLYYAPDDDKYKHIKKEDIEKVEKCLNDKHAWFEEKSFAINKIKLYEDPPVLVSQIKDEKNSLEKTAWTILNKPKPKVEPPKPKVEEPAAAEEEQKPANGEQQQAPDADKMDLD